MRREDGVKMKERKTEENWQERKARLTLGTLGLIPSSNVVAHSLLQSISRGSNALV